MNVKSIVSRIVLAAVAVSVVATAAGAQSVDAPQQIERKRQCRWWQFGHCDQNQKEIEGLPDGAPREGTVITVDVSTNTAYLFQDATLVSKSPAATGTGKLLKHRGRIWLFHTPRGRMKVLRKLENPVWRKPDWAFVEAGEPIPPPESPTRLIKGHLGKYALDLGDSVLIHGTNDPDSIGRPASHGCIRLPKSMLEKVYAAAKIGTEVFIFESAPPQVATNKSGLPERHSDLD